MTTGKILFSRLVSIGYSLFSWFIITLVVFLIAFLVALVVFY
jgi:hypothetical protein